jgi:hypothetical protein
MTVTHYHHSPNASFIEERVGKENNLGLGHTNSSKINNFLVVVSPRGTLLVLVFFV